MGESDETSDRGNSEKALPPQAAPKPALNKFHLKCVNCDFRASSAMALEKHARVKHLDQEWYRCKLCNVQFATSEWMNIHLTSDSHLQRQKENNGSEFPLSQVCVESVHRGSAGDDAAVGDVEGSIGEEIPALTEGEQEVDEAEESSKSVQAEEEAGELEPPKKKKGRPKLGGSVTCEHCGLVVSNATNLSVHVRRKHSKEYGYCCTLCNYSCVTKGDMDRHCFTKKHVKRAQAGSNKNPATAPVVASLLESTVTQNPALQTADAEQESNNALSQEFKVEEQALSDTPSTSRSDSISTCSLCGFVAQSIPSLHLHVKRKHTKDFEYVCLACGYYAVTSREMCRHVSTEKHRQKSLKYIEMQGSKESELPQNKREGDDPPVGNLNPERPHSAGASDSSSSDNRGLEVQNPSTSPVTSEVERVVVGAASSAHEEQVKTVASSARVDPDPVNQTAELAALSEAQQASGELELSLEASAQQESQEEEAELVGDESLKADGMIVDTHMSKGFPFDACIVSVKVLAEQEKALLESLALGRESSVICLTGGSSCDLGSSTSAHVRKLKPKEGKDTTGRSSHLRCEDCGFMADGLSGLNVHISMKHPSKERHFHCLLCGKSFYTESNLHQHLTSAAHIRNEQNSVEALPEGGASFKCVKCTDRFDTEQDLFFHIKEKHEELLKEVSKYVLEDTEQINREREENKGSVCKYCGKVCKSSNSMAFLAHIRTHTGSKPFMCKICNFATAQLGDARNHVKRHLGMREYKCDICGWAFVMKKHLNIHLLGKHGVGERKERKFECDLCDRSFSEKWALNNHMKLHNGEKPYKCAWPSCHYSFLNLSAMKDHYRTHTGEKSYLCDLCGFAGGTRHALTKHRRQHTGERPFKCKLCNFASTTQSHLSRHKRVHTGEKPYRCPWCDYRSNCAENIRKHILHTGKHDGVKMYNCPKCIYATNSPMEFRNHLKEGHPDIENPDLAYLHAACCQIRRVSRSPWQQDCLNAGQRSSLCNGHSSQQSAKLLVTTDRQLKVAGDDPGPPVVTSRVSHQLQDPGGQALKHRHQVDGIVSKSFECRLKGQGAAFVETDSVDSPVHQKGSADSVQQVIIIQGYGNNDVAIDQALEESAAVTLQTLAMAGQVAEVLHITEDGQVIASGSEVASTGAHLAGGTTQYVVLDSGDASKKLQAVAGEEMAVTAAAQNHAISESSTALDALLSAVSEMGHQDKMQEEEVAVVHEVLAPETAEEDPGAGMEVKQEQEEVHVIEESSHEDMQEVLQLAASQMVKEGLTQVIVNDEGTHYIVTELDDCTLQVEGAVYGEGEEQQVEQPAAEEMVVYLDGASHNIVLEG
ncbi:zinc finger protein 407 [Nematolebias whitei]|uniref:zinc finger protein 407 n=1 Tax=Nematolebias whitei TaxID=451745 RepID=UPI001898A586|nr:zinc finger protein 407 [Nematolebias whitei]